jgi:hypothetical protein
MRVRRKSPAQPGDMSTPTAWFFTVIGAAAILGLIALFVASLFV